MQPAGAKARAMTLLFKPEDVPVLSFDSHLPPVAAASCGPAAIRLRFGAPPHWEPEIKVEKRFIDRPATPASVLIAIVLREEPTVLLTQRTDHLNDHPSQISFPGGRVDPGDADAVATALREAEERSASMRRGSRCSAVCPLHHHTGFVVTPIVGLVGLASSSARSVRGAEGSRCRSPG